MKITFISINLEYSKLFFIVWAGLSQSVKSLNRNRLASQGTMGILIAHCLQKQPQLFPGSPTCQFTLQIFNLLASTITRANFLHQSKFSLSLSTCMCICKHTHMHTHTHPISVSLENPNTVPTLLQYSHQFQIRTYTFQIILNFSHPLNISRPCYPLTLHVFYQVS